MEGVAVKLQVGLTLALVSLVRWSVASQGYAVLAPSRFVAGDGMTQSVTLMANDGVDGPFEFEHFRGSWSWTACWGGTSAWLVIVDEASLLLPLELELSEELSLEELLVESCLLACCLGYGQHYWRLFRDGLIWAQLWIGRERSTWGRLYCRLCISLVWNACDGLLKGNQQVWVCHIEDGGAPPVF